MVHRFIDSYCRLLGWLMAAALAVMVVLVFGNVVMRYAFNSGFTVSEELSRWLFVWMTFLGSVVALHEGTHLGTDMLVGRLRATGRRICLGLALMVMLYVLWLLCKGSYEQFRLNLDSESPVMEVSMGWFYGAGMAFGLLSAPILLNQLYRLLTGQIDDSQLLMIQESEESAVDVPPPHVR